MNEEHDPNIGQPLHPDLKPKSSKATGEQAGKPKKRRRKPLTQAELFKKCRSAAHVYLALCGMADANRFVFPTRQAIAERCGIRKLDTISEAFRELEKARWIEVWRTTVGGADGFATLLKIRVVFMDPVFRGS